MLVRLASRRRSFRKGQRACVLVCMCMCICVPRAWLCGKWARGLSMRLESRSRSPGYSPEDNCSIFQGDARRAIFFLSFYLSLSLAHACTSLTQTSKRSVPEEAWLARSRERARTRVLGFNEEERSALVTRISIRPLLSKHMCVCVHIICIHMHILVRFCFLRMINAGKLDDADTRPIDGSIYTRLRLRINHHATCRARSFYFASVMPAFALVPSRSLALPSFLFSVSRLRAYNKYPYKLPITSYLFPPRRYR